MGGVLRGPAGGGVRACLERIWCTLRTATDIRYERDAAPIEFSPLKDN